MSNVSAQLTNGNRTVEITADIVNLGEGPSSATVAYVVNEFGSLESIDEPVRVDGLDRQRSSPVKIQLHIPYEMRDREHTFMVHVDPVPGEINLRNNESTTEPIFIPHQPPDLEVIDARAELSDDGRTVRITATIRNVGEGPAEATSLRTIKGTPGLLSLLFGPRPGWVSPGAVDIPELGPAEEHPPVELLLDEIPYDERNHDHVFTLRLESANGEENLVNNEQETNRVTIPHLSPDLEVTNAVATVSSDNKSIEIAADIKNIGEGPSYATHVFAYSTDPNWWRRGPRVGPLEPGEPEHHVEFELSIPDEQRDAEHTFVVRAKWVAIEPNTDNNDAETPPIFISLLPPNLAVRNPVASLSIDDLKVVVTATIRNTGEGPADSTEAYAFSSAADWGSKPFYVESLPSGVEQEIRFEFDIPYEYRGASHTFTVRAEPVAREIDTSNNEADARSLFIGHLSADLVVADPVPSLIADGHRILITATIENGGKGPSDQTDVLAFSGNTAWGSASVSIHPLQPQGDAEVRIEFDIPSEMRGSEHIFTVRVAPVTNEANEDNNEADAPPIFVGHLPSNLVVVDPTASLTANERKILITAEIANIGEGPADPTQATATSTDANWESEASLVGSLLPGGAHPIEIPIEIDLDIPYSQRGVEHTFTLRVTPIANESDVSDNEGVTKPLFIPHLPPNLAVTEVAAQISSNRRAIDLSAVVENTGEGPAEATTLEAFSIASDWWGGSSRIRTLGRGQTESICVRLAIPDDVRGSEQSFEFRLDPVARDTNPDDDSDTTPLLKIPQRSRIPAWVWPSVVLVGSAGVAGGAIGMRQLGKRRFRRKRQQEDATEKEPKETCTPGETRCRRKNLKLDPKSWKIVKLIAPPDKGNEKLEAPAIAKRKLNAAIAAARRKAPKEDLQKQLETAARVLLQWVARSFDGSSQDVALAAQLDCGKLECSFVLSECQGVGGASSWQSIDEWKATLKAEREEPVVELKHVQEETPEETEQRRQELASTLAEFAQRVSKLRLRLRDAKLEIERED